MSYLVEQLPHCDLLRLSLLTGDLSCQLDKSSKSYCQISSTFHHNLKVVILLSENVTSFTRASDCRIPPLFITIWKLLFCCPKTLHLSPERRTVGFLHFSSQFESCYFAAWKRYIFHHWHIIQQESEDSSFLPLAGAAAGLVAGFLAALLAGLDSCSTAHGKCSRRTHKG